MPCYCDIPSSKNQKEIQERCKINMYLDSLLLLTHNQKKIAHAANLPAFPLPEVNTALCKLCKILTQKQRKEISAYYFQIEWTHRNLDDWYQQHCRDDENYKNNT